VCLQLSWNDISPYSKTVDDHRQVLIKVDEKIYEIEDEVHIYVILTSSRRIFKLRDTLYRVIGGSVNMKKAGNKKRKTTG